MNAVAAFPLVEIEGTPRDRGVSYGEQASGQIAHAASHYEKALSHLGVVAAEADRLADAFLARIEDFDLDLTEEIRGISLGSGTPLAGVVLINARRELLSMAGKLVSDAEDDECTAAAVLPTATSDGVLIHGQNWDTSPDHAEYSLVLRIRQRSGPDILTFTEAGAVGRSGLNAAGIAITGNNLVSDRDYRAPGVPLPLIRRRALATDVYALALSVVYATKKAGSNNMMLSHAQGEVVNIECAPDESFLLHPDDSGVIAHANHWEHLAALTKLRDLGATNDPALAATPCTMFRSARTRRLLRQEAADGGVTLDAFKRTLLDSFGTPYSICRPPRAAAIGDGASATAASIVAVPEHGYLDIAPLPALGASWTRYSVHGGPAVPVEGPRDDA